MNRQTLFILPFKGCVNMQTNKHFNHPTPTQPAWLMPARLAIMVALTAALAACGGGGSGDSDTTASGNGSSTASGGYVVTTIAGGRVGDGVGFADGPGTTALFNNPMGIALGPDGCLYVADKSNNRIRKIAANGVVSTVAGTDEPPPTGSCISDGPCASATLGAPWGIAVDKSGSIYVADQGSHAIRKITNPGTASCMVSTLAGSCGKGYADGQGSSAGFEFPNALTLDADGNLYVTDNSSVRKITPAGYVTTLAGSATESGAADGMGLSARFGLLQGIALDAKGNLYVSDF